MTDTQQTATERAREAIYLDGFAVEYVDDMMAALTAANLTITDAAELEQLRADVAALVAFVVEVDDCREQSDGTSWWETELAIRPPEYATEARLRAAIEPILARYRAAQEGRG